MGRPKKYQTEEERKAARAAQRNQYYQEHKDYFKQYYQDNRETMLNQQKQYYQEHKADVAAYQRHHYEDNRTTIREQQKEYKTTPFGRAVNIVNAYRQNDVKYNRGECTITPEWMMHCRHYL